MTKAELKSFIVALSPPEGMQKPQLDNVVDPAIDAAFNHVWTAHWWNFRMKRTELSATSTYPYVECPEDFEQGIHLLREGTPPERIKVVSPARFYDDHPYPEGESGGRPSEATLLYDSTWGAKPYRLYLHPKPSETFTLPMLYLRVGTSNEIGNMPGYFVTAVIMKLKALIGYISDEDATIALELAREKGGGFIAPQGRADLEGINDLNSWTAGSGTTAVPYGFYG